MGGRPQIMGSKDRTLTQPSAGFHSVVAPPASGVEYSTFAHTEVVVYDKASIYPEFVVHLSKRPAPAGART
eukprot:NODE_4748_length_336_cov_240.439024_g4139_i0.p1 GENE.NODE_4748_length_336_cov_240.439024_g4139_i0~~NODE_4748_length_336_cov_240.439024_g4139_i0.p1  ORF type:complete len:71 (-),score=6.56 NODE_4748_length_336_cov_240.439024_g4139_i0:93-305(-)